MCRGNVRSVQPQEPQEIQPDQWMESALYNWQQYREEEDEDRYNFIDRLREEQQREAHEAQLRASAERRAVFLAQQKDSFIDHCMTCNDQACISIHARQTRWLIGRGKLVPLPPRIKSLDRLILGFMLGKGRGCIGVAMRGRIGSQIIQLHGSIPHGRRIAKLLHAIRDQQNTKECYRSHRERTKESVALRLTDHTAGLPAIVTQLQTKNPEISTEFPNSPNYSVKLFRGYTPPKRRARVGDIHQKIDGVRGMCVGWNLWAYSNGTRLRLDGKHWISC
jgi:hypothetical protein